MTPAGVIARTLPVLSVGEFAQFQRLIYAKAGIRLAEDKRTLVSTRLARRMRDLARSSGVSPHASSGESVTGTRFG